MTEQEIVPAPAETAEDRRPQWRAIAVVAGAVVVAAGGLGWLGGWLWYQWWGPPNTGEIYDTSAWGPRWFDLSDQGLSHQFDGPAQYTVIALGLGALLGILAAVLGRRQAVAAVVALALGSALAAYLSWLVGTMLSPPDPQKFATAENVCSEEPCQQYLAAIEVSGWTPFLCWPIAALGAFSVAIVVMSWFGTTKTMLGELGPLAAHPSQVKESDDRPVP